MEITMNVVKVLKKFPIRIEFKFGDDRVFKI